MLSWLQLIKRTTFSSWDRSLGWKGSFWVPFEGCLVQSSFNEQGHLQLHGIARSYLQPGLEFSKERASSASLGKLFQSFTILSHSKCALFYFEAIFPVCSNSRGAVSCHKVTGDIAVCDLSVLLVCQVSGKGSLDSSGDSSSLKEILKK